MLRRTVPLQRSPIAHWRAGAGAAVYVGDTYIYNVDNHLSLMLHSINGKLQFMQRERRQPIKNQLDYNITSLKVDRDKLNACQTSTGKTSIKVELVARIREETCHFIISSLLYTHSFIISLLCYIILFFLSSSSHPLLLTNINLFLLIIII